MNVKSIFGALVIGFLLSSCELQTQEPSQPVLKPANHLVINEVFTLPKTNQRFYSWIEFYNPTRDSINLGGWTFSFTTTGTITRYAVDTANRPIPGSIVVLRQGDGVWDIPLPPFRIEGGQFLTATDNEARLLSYTEYGPGDGRKEEVGSFFGLTIRFAGADSSKPDTVINFQAEFHFRSTDQLVLKDQNGNVVDVVRYGNYVYPGPGADPYPANHSMPLIPEYQSIARWNGAYFTGNSAEDFYITGTQVPLTRPIPHWLSQAYHR